MDCLMMDCLQGSVNVEELGNVNNEERVNNNEIKHEVIDDELRVNINTQELAYANNEDQVNNLSRNNGMKFMNWVEM